MLNPLEPAWGPWLSWKYEPERVTDPELVHVEVWVHLDRLCPRPADDRRRVIVDGLDFTGKVRGALTRWLKTGDGAWLGLVDYKINYVDGRKYTRDLKDQLVPAWALSQREDH